METRLVKWVIGVMFGGASMESRGFRGFGWCSGGSSDWRRSPMPLLKEGVRVGGHTRALASLVRAPFVLRKGRGGLGDGLLAALV